MQITKCSPTQTSSVTSLPLQPFLTCFKFFQITNAFFVFIVDCDV